MSKSQDAQTRALAALNVGQREQQARMPEPAGAARRERPSKAAPKPKTPVERLHLHLPPKVISALKVQAAKRGTSPSQVVLEALRKTGVL